MISVEDLLTSKGVVTRSTGSKVLISCLNPEHEDTHPSMVVNTTTGDAHCFSCGHNLNVYKHFGIIHNKLNSKAFKILKVIDAKRNPVLSMPAGSEPWDKEFRGVGLSTFKHFGVFKNNIEYADKICFPIYGFDGQLKSILSRDLHSKATRYLVYPPGQPLPIFPTAPQPYKNTLIIVEGIFDVLSAYDKGIKNVVCTFGVNLTPNIITQICTVCQMLNVSRLVIAFDNDKAGQKAAELAQISLSKRVETVEILDWEELCSLSEHQIKDFGELKTDDIFSLLYLLYGGK